MLQLAGCQVSLTQLHAREHAESGAGAIRTLLRLRITERMQRCIQSPVVVVATSLCPIRVYKRQLSNLRLTSPSTQPLSLSRFLRMQSASEKVKERMGAKQAPEAGLSVNYSSMAPCHLHDAVYQFPGMQVAKSL